MRGGLHLEERVAVAYEMLNRTVTFYDGLWMSPASRRRLTAFTRRVMCVLIGSRDDVPRELRDRIRPMRRRER